ncbi:conserved hypothetical protein [Aspergillus lentulus]|nr:conserved hypothetical protein [Aspergillus lentulus]
MEPLLSRVWSYLNEDIGEDLLLESQLLLLSFAPGLLKGHNWPRNRRVLFLVMLTAGCFVGAFTQRAVNSSFALLWCAVGKALVTVSWLWNKRLEKRCP